MQENTFIIEPYFLSGRVVNGNGNILCLNAIIEETALHHYVVMKRKFTGRPQTDQNVVDQVEELVVENPHSSTCRMSAQTNVSNVRKSLTRRLHMHPLKCLQSKKSCREITTVECSIATFFNKT
jgi:hypothetical protein